MAPARGVGSGPVESGFAFTWGLSVRLESGAIVHFLWGPSGPDGGNQSRSQCPSAPVPLRGPDGEGHSG